MLLQHSSHHSAEAAGSGMRRNKHGRKQVWAVQRGRVCLDESPSEANCPPQVSAPSLPSDRPSTPSDDLPLVLQVLRVWGGGVAALGTVRVAESPR